MAAELLRVIPCFSTKYSKNCLFFCKHIRKLHCEFKKLHCSSRWEDVLPTQLHILHHTIRRHWRAAIETGCILFQLPTHGLTVNTFQVSIQWQNCCQEWINFSNCAVGRSFQPPKQRTGHNAQHREKSFLLKKYKIQLLSSLQKTKSMQPIGSVFADRIEQVKKIKLELKQIKILDCFLHGHGIYTSQLESFFKKIFVN